MPDKYYEHKVIYDDKHHAIPDTWKEMPTLRDQFAMAAMTGIITNPVYDEMTCEIVAKISYSIADAMLEARKEKKDDPQT